MAEKENPYHIYDGPAGENPGMGEIITQQQNLTIKLNELESNLINQYEYLQDLGKDYIIEFDDLITNDIYEKMIAYIDENYLSIGFIEQIYNSDDNLRLITRTIYEILFVDFIKFFIPNILKEIESEDPDDLKKMSTSDLSTHLLEVSSKNLREFNEIGQDNIVYKLGFATDLFNNNLSDFKNNFLLPCIENNYEEIKLNLD